MSARQYPESTRAGVTALARAIELHDPVAARRAAWRAALVQRWLIEVDADPGDLADAIAGALLVDLAHLVAPGPTWATTDISGAVLGASLTSQLPRSQRCATTLRHTYEHWDGTGGPHALSGTAIPIASRVVAIANALTGKLVNRSEPNWRKRRRQVADAAGTRFDPDLATEALEVLKRAPVTAADATVSNALLTLADLSEGDGSPQAHLALETIGATLDAAMNRDELIELVAEQTRAAVGATRVSVGRLTDDGAHLEVLLNVGDLGRGERRRPDNETYPLVALPSFTAFVTGHCHLVTLRDDDRAVVDYLARRELSSEIATHASVDGSSWVLWATTSAEEPQFTDAELATLRVAASQLATGVKQAATIEQYERYAFRDALTGLWNRRILDTKLREIFARPPMDRIDCGLIMCDVDELKVVNDTDGHAAGDKILRAAADALLEAVAEVEGATVCRIGGDEFCVILDGGGLLRAEPIADHAKAIFRRSGENRSMSCGVAVASQNVALPGDLLRAADVAQYEQKRKRKAELGVTLPEYPERASGGRRARRDSSPREAPTR